MDRFPNERPDTDLVPSFNLIAVLPHAAGGFQAMETHVNGATREELLTAAWVQCIGSRYVARLCDVETGDTVWSESRGWHEDTPEHDS